MLATVLGTAACGEKQQRSAQNLCASYRQLIGTAGALRTLDEHTASPAEIRARADATLRQLDALQGALEGGYDSQISALRAAVYDIKHSAVEDDSHAITQTSKGRRDTLKSLDQGLAPLQTRLAVQCAAAS